MTQPSKQFPTHERAMTTEHTQLPWRADVEHVITAGFEGGWLVATCHDAEASQPQEADANAAYIVKACNAYPELVEALRWTLKLLETLDTHHTHRGIVRTALNSDGVANWDKARAVLATIDKGE